MRFRVTHTTRYRYPATVHGSLNEVRLKPRPSAQQRLERFTMEIEPSPDYLAEHVDAFGNPAGVMGIERDHREWSVTAVSEVIRFAAEAELAFEPALPVAGSLHLLRAGISAEVLEARGFTQPSPLLPPMAGLPGILGFEPNPEQGIEAFARQLSRFIHESFAYRPGQTEISTPLTQVIEQRAGVCQDFAHLAIACARALGIPARYISGYLETLPPEGSERLSGTDASHAWFAVYDPTRGWLEFDPTNDNVPDLRYITLAWGRDYSDVAPIRGVVRGGGESHRLLVSVDVQRLDGGGSVGS